jgi:hypothetical protein
MFGFVDKISTAAVEAIVVIVTLIGQCGRRVA